MPCYHPLQAFKLLGHRTKNNKSVLVFKKDLSVPSQEVKLPCGQCIGCRLERSRQWAVRCMHEASLYDNNCFITLTYSDEYLPRDNSLNVKHFQDFMKRLRKKYGSGIRYYHCGEYGEKYGRPHYHACVFNLDFPDKYLFKDENGIKLYRSEALEKLWPFGHSSIGSVTFDSAAYVARYIMKKVTGDSSFYYYRTVDFETGEIVAERKPEYNTMSQGIGKNWYEEYQEDVYPRDYVVVNGKEVRPPKYYDRLYEVEYPSDFARLKESRKLNAKKYADNNTPDRLKTREQVKLSRLNNLPRKLDKDL